MARKLQNPARKRLDAFLQDYPRIANAEISKFNQLEFYSIDGHLVCIVDMYSKNDGTYQGFEVLTPTEGSGVTDAIDTLESLSQ